MVTNNTVGTAEIEVSQPAKDQMLSLPGISKMIELPKPPFPHLLQSNTPPTDLEAIEILKEISTVEAQSLHLQENIQDHDPDWMVEHQLDLACQFVDAHRSILSAIRRIPPEVLQMIFFQSVLSWVHLRWYIIRSLSQVCQRWRATAHSITSLGSTLPAIYLYEQTPCSHVAEIEECLVRSRDAPISFHLSAFASNWESHPIIDALTRHPDRWQVVTIECINLTPSIFKGINGRLPSLRTLSLRIYRQTRPLVVDMFEDAPQLREVHIQGGFFGEFRLPFSQLTRYSECVRGRGMVVRTISLATSLTTLEITRFSESPDIPITTLPFLITLKVKFDVRVYRLRGFLDRLTLPVIQEICITGYTAIFVPEIIDMISRSHSPSTLKKFSLRLSKPGGLGSGELTRLLRLTPDLVALTLTSPPLEDLANLIIGKNSPPLIPLLQILIIKAGSTRGPKTSQLLNAIAVSRCNLQDSIIPAVPHLPADYQALKELRIIFHPSTVRQYELRFLEGWVPSEESEQLIIWKEKLLEELPELELQSAPLNRESDLKWRDRVFDIFSEIQKFHVKNVNDIYISEMQIILKRFVDQPVTSIISQFGERAGEILEKWTPIFESHLKERRWVLKGRASLLYLSIDDPLWLSPNRLDISYGLENFFREPSWNTHDYDDGLGCITGSGICNACRSYIALPGFGV